MMRKKFVFGFIVFVMIILTGSWAFAQCPDIKGDWDITKKCMEYDPEDNRYEHSRYQGILHITDQKNCLFQGNVEFLGGYPETGVPITGAMSKSGSVTMNCGGKEIISGTLGGFDEVSSLYKSMKLTWCEVDEEGDFGTCKSKATRR